MAARSVLKLLTKTCSYSLNPCQTTISTVTPEKTLHRQNRSIPSSPHRHSISTKKLYTQKRKVSKSLHNFRESRYKDEDHEVTENEDQLINLNKFPRPTDLSLRDPAKEFKEHSFVNQEVNEEGNPIYELAEGSRTQENYYDVNYAMRRLEAEKAARLFVDLQPSSLRPYGSTHNMIPMEGFKKAHPIVYPAHNAPGSTEFSKRKKIDDIQSKDFSSSAQKEILQSEETAKSSVGNSIQNEFDRKKYSTDCSKKKPVENRPHLKINSVRRSCTLLRNNRKDSMVKLNNDARIEKFYKEDGDGPKSDNNVAKLAPVKESRLQCLRNLAVDSSRQYNTQSHTTEEVCEDYVTVKLGDLQEECRKAKKCKPKKISFGRLPKIQHPDCPCTYEISLKEGKPLDRLKKRFDYKDPERICKERVICDPASRADANYEVKPKKLPVLQIAECPCEEVEMTDLVIKRLPKVDIPEPPKVCKVCVGEECCPPRADGKICVEQKILPKLEPQDCPCTEQPPLKAVPLKKLTPKPVKEPERICIDKEACDLTLRADHGLKVEKKVLPTLKPSCECYKPPPMDEGEPLKRMKKIKLVEKPRPCKPKPCERAVRADSKLKVKKKKLPKFIPIDCPCVDPPPLTESPKLKRLPKQVYKDKEIVCKKEVCLPRADDGLVVKPKQLPILEPKPCDCPSRQMIDAPPLKKLVPKPVEEPPRVCKIEVCDESIRADADLKVQAKSLPVLPPGSCPCVTPPPPLDVKPLPKLVPRPVTYTRACPAAEKKCDPQIRADEHLKVKIKKLPKLTAPDCPCVEPPPPEDIRPLRRLKKVHIPEPCRVCPKVDFCEEIPRADEDDWLYWKRVEVKSADCESKNTKKKTNARCYSSVPRRYYSTRTRPEHDLFNLQYDIPRIPTSTLRNEAYNVIIDIKPSAPLILTQKQLELKKDDSVEDPLDGKKIKRSKSGPVDGVTFVIFKSNSLGSSKPLKESSSEVSLVFNTLNHRFISTCSTLNASPREESHFQPRNPILSEKERFITPYPSDDEIEIAARKSRKFNRTRKDEKGGGKIMVCKDDAEEEKQHEQEKEKQDVICDKPEKKISLWERIVNYFKARPNCPSPEEYKKMRLKEEAEKAAHAAGMCLYDPKELLRKSEKELPKVITADTNKEECEK